MLAQKCCTHPGCQRKHHSMTLCPKHYTAEYTRAKAANFISMQQNGLAPKCCTHPGCQKMLHTSTLCKTHYQTEYNRAKKPSPSSVFGARVALTGPLRPTPAPVIVHRTLEVVKVKIEQGLPPPQATGPLVPAPPAPLSCSFFLTPFFVGQKRSRAAGAE